MGLETLINNPGCEWLPSEPVLHVATSHALIQAAGHIKYNLAREGKRVLFRGQRKLYGGLIPTLFRGEGGGPLALGTAKSRTDSLTKKIEKVTSAQAFLNNTNDLAKEPLLQHYGMNTPWLDLVDNVWVALWFATHRAVPHKDNPHFVHFEQRSIRHKEDDGFAYVLLLSAPYKVLDASNGSQQKPSNENQDTVGFYKEDNLILVDLRQAAPSTYLRPHAQHGLLLKRDTLNTKDDIDLKDRIAGTVRVYLEDALQWLGTGSLLSVHSLFPPAGYDYGYACLLNKYPEGEDEQHLGCIQMVSP